MTADWTRDVEERKSVLESDWSSLLCNESGQISHTDLPPWATACWDRDGVSEWLDESDFLLTKSAVDGRFTVYAKRLFLAEDAAVIPWMHYVEDPVPHWVSDVIANERGWRGNGRVWDD